MPGNRAGDRKERELVNLLDEHGFAVMRAPASGSKTDRELPDVLAGDGETFLAIELKYSSNDPIYFDGEEVADLRYFAERFGADTVIAVAFRITNGDPAWGTDQSGFYLFATEECHQTKGGNYRVKKETALERGRPVETLWGET